MLQRKRLDERTDAGVRTFQRLRFFHLRVSEHLGSVGLSGEGLTAFLVLLRFCQYSGWFHIDV